MTIKRILNRSANAHEHTYSFNSYLISYKHALLLMEQSPGKYCIDMINLAVKQTNLCCNEPETEQGLCPTCKEHL